MLPGVVGRERGGGSLEGVQKGQTCAVALVGNRYIHVHVYIIIYIYILW